MATDSSCSIPKSGRISSSWTRTYLASSVEFFRFMADTSVMCGYGWNVLCCLLSSSLVACIWTYVSVYPYLYTEHCKPPSSSPSSSYSSVGKNSLGLRHPQFAYPRDDRQLSQSCKGGLSSSLNDSSLVTPKKFLLVSACLSTRQSKGSVVFHSYTRSICKRLWLSVSLSFSCREALSSLSRIFRRGMLPGELVFFVYFLVIFEACLYRLIRWGKTPAMMKRPSYRHNTEALGIKR